MIFLRNIKKYLVIAIIAHNIRKILLNFTAGNRNGPFKGIVLNEAFLFKTILFAIICFIFFIHFTFLVPGTDQGVYMYGAFLLSKGRLPYNDLWENKPPLIYLIGLSGFFIKSNPFLGVRIVELVIFFFELYYIDRIVRILKAGSSVLYLTTFCALYLIFWERGFLTETFNIPLVLLSVYLFLKKAKYLECNIALMLVLSFILKQNSIAIIGILILTDSISSYRKGNTVNKLLLYALFILLYCLFVLAILITTGMLANFIDQVFVYEAQHFGGKYHYLFVVHDQMSKPQYILINGVIIIMLFRYLYRKHDTIQFNNKFIFYSTIVYFVAFFFAYVSGLNSVHYFLLLIVPATFILGFSFSTFPISRLLLLCLIFIGIRLNILKMVAYNDVLSPKKELISFIKKNTSENDYIYYFGHANSYTYVMTNRLSNTKFITPNHLEKWGYTARYKTIIDSDFSKKPPALIITPQNKEIFTSTDYTANVIRQVLNNYAVIQKSDEYIVYKHL